MLSFVQGTNEAGVSMFRSLKGLGEVEKIRIKLACSRLHLIISTLVHIV